MIFNEKHFRQKATRKKQARRTFTTGRATHDKSIKVLLLGRLFHRKPKTGNMWMQPKPPLRRSFSFWYWFIGKISEHCFYCTVSNIFHADIVVGNALAATSGNALHHCNSDFVMQIKQNNLKQECFSTKFYKIIYFSAKHALHFRAKTDSRAANAYRQACFFPPECKVHYTIKTYLRKKQTKTTQQCTAKT